MMNRSLPAILVLVFCTLLSGLGDARANSSYRSTWQNTYPEACSTLVAKANDCTLCHTSVPHLNPYGTDLAGTTPLAIEGLDSDGDGYTNGQEIVIDCTDPGTATEHGVVADLPSTWSLIKALFR